MLLVETISSLYPNTNIKAIPAFHHFIPTPPTPLPPHRHTHTTPGLNLLNSNKQAEEQTGSIKGIILLLAGKRWNLEWACIYD